MHGTAAQATRLRKLEAPGRPGMRPGGVLVMPHVLPVDAWERLALPQQQALATATRAGVTDNEERR